MIRYLLKAALLAACLASPLLPAVYMFWDQLQDMPAPLEYDCMTDTECQRQYGGDGSGLD